MAERTITMGSAGKTFSVTGWKIGWAIGPAHLISAMHLFHHLAVRGTPSVLQVNYWCDTIYANFTEITRNDWVYHMMELLNSDKIMNYPFNHTMFFNIFADFRRDWKSFGNLESLGTIKYNAQMSIEDFYFTGSISNSIRDGGNSYWKSRLLLFSVVQTNGAETERAVHLP